MVSNVVLRTWRRLSTAQCHRLRRLRQFSPLKERSKLPRLLTSLPQVQHAPSQRRAWRRIPIAGSRSRQRQRRACGLRPRASSAHFGWSPAEPEPRRQLCRATDFLQRKQLISRAARTAIPEVERGRRRQVIDSILEGLCLKNFRNLASFGQFCPSARLAAIGSIAFLPRRSAVMERWGACARPAGHCASSAARPNTYFAPVR